MTFFDHTDGDDSDWLIVYFPEILLCAFLLPIIIFLVTLAVILL